MFESAKNTFGAIITGSALLLPAASCEDANSPAETTGHQVTEIISNPGSTAQKPETISIKPISELKVNGLSYPVGNNAPMAKVQVWNKDSAFNFRMSQLPRESDVKVICEGSKTAVKFVLDTTTDSVTIQVKDADGYTEAEAEKYNRAYKDVCGGKGYRVEMNI